MANLDFRDRCIPCDDSIEYETSDLKRLEAIVTVWNSMHTHPVLDDTRVRERDDYRPREL